MAASEAPRRATQNLSPATTFFEGQASTLNLRGFINTYQTFVEPLVSLAEKRARIYDGIVRKNTVLCGTSSKTIVVKHQHFLTSLLEQSFHVTPALSLMRRAVPHRSTP